MKPTETQKNPKKLHVHVHKTEVWWTCNQTVKRDVVMMPQNIRLNRRRKKEKKGREFSPCKVPMTTHLGQSCLDMPVPTSGLRCWVRMDER